MKHRIVVVDVVEVRLGHTEIVPVLGVRLKHVETMHLVGVRLKRDGSDRHSPRLKPDALTMEAKR